MEPTTLPFEGTPPSTPSSLGGAWVALSVALVPNAPLRIAELEAVAEQIPAPQSTGVFPRSMAEATTNEMIDGQPDQDALKDAQLELTQQQGFAIARYTWLMACILALEPFHDLIVQVRRVGAISTATACTATACTATACTATDCTATDCTATACTATAIDAMLYIDSTATHRCRQCCMCFL